MAFADKTFGTGGPSAAAGGSYDADRLLAGYRAARAQQALFDLRQGPASGYDEFVGPDGKVRPAWTELADAIGERGRAGLDRLRSVVRGLIDHDGIAYTDVEPGGRGQEPRPWQLDTLPIVLSAADWEPLEAGLLQRSRVLDAVLADLYGPRSLLTEGVLPPGAAVRPSQLPARRQRHRNPGPSPAFHARLRCQPAPGRRLRRQRRPHPGSLGHRLALADRRVVAHAIPDLYERIAPRPTTPFAQALRLALIDAAPDVAQDPVVVVLSPGIYSETAFDQAYLATLLGFPLVESADLVVRDGMVWMRSLGTPKRVDMVLRRVDAEYCDPLDLRADSRLGVAGLVEAQHRGTVTVVNTLGSGILETLGCNVSCRRWRSTCCPKRCCCPARRSTGAASTPNVHTCWPIWRRYW